MYSFVNLYFLNFVKGIHDLCNKKKNVVEFVCLSSLFYFYDIITSYSTLFFKFCDFKEVYAILEPLYIDIK